MFDAKHDDICFALEAVHRSMALLKKLTAESDFSFHTKTDNSPVTVGDFAVQALVGHLLEEKFPADKLAAEEKSEALRSREGSGILGKVSGLVSSFAPEADPVKICRWIDRGAVEISGHRFWALDPIDGTKGFLRGDQYVVALALMVNSRVELGIVGCPHLKEARFSDRGGPGSLVIAQRGKGAWVTPWNHDGNYAQFSRLHVSSCSDPRQARILSSVESGHTNMNCLEDLIRSVGVQREPVTMDSQAKHVFVASGAADLFFRFLSPRRPDYREKIWDQAAGALIVEEAGGEISDLEGKPLDFSTGTTLDHNRGIVVSNGRLHSEVIKALHSLRVENKI